MDGGPAVLLMPEGMQAAALGAAAEILVEERPGTTAKRRFLHIFDNVERVEKLKGSPNAVSEAERRVHEQRLKEYRWACDVLWGESQLQPFLGTPEPALWPDLASLKRAVDVVKLLKSYTAEADVGARGRENLSRAVDIVERETRYAGVHPLKEATVAGQLVRYEVAQWLRSTGAVKMSLPDALVKQEGRRKGDELTAAWLVEPSTSMLMAADVLALPMTQRTVERLVALVAAPPVAVADARSTWQSLLTAHTQSLQSGRVALAGSVRDIASAFHASEGVVVKLTAHHAAPPRCASVRLRVGVFVTAVHREILFLVCGKAARAARSPKEREDFQRLTGLDLGALLAGGLARLVELQLDRAGVHALVRETFLSPALGAQAEDADAYHVELVGSIGQTTEGRGSTALDVFKVTATHNPFLVVHGPRVLGGATGADAMAGLLKRRREAETDAELHQVMSALTAADAAGKDRETTATPTFASPVRGEDLHVAIGRGVVAALAEEPLSKAALTSHAALAPFAKRKEFESILKEALRTHSEYKNRKYFLRQ